MPYICSKSAQPIAMRSSAAIQCAPSSHPSAESAHGPASTTALHAAPVSTQTAPDDSHQTWRRGRITALDTSAVPNSIRYHGCRIT
jgi:hypothetical protein